MIGGVESGEIDAGMVSGDDSGLAMMVKEMEMITKGLRDSGLLVNESKTEGCLFHKNP